jgi:hypothetical protein
VLDIFPSDKAFHGQLHHVGWQTLLPEFALDQSCFLPPMLPHFGCGIRSVRPRMFRPTAMYGSPLLTRGVQSTRLSFRAVVTERVGSTLNYGDRLRSIQRIGRNGLTGRQAREHRRPCAGPSRDLGHQSLALADEVIE